MDEVMTIPMTVTEDSENIPMTLDMQMVVGGGAVDSVNGMTGDVVLTASDVGALPDDTTIPTKTSDLQNDSGYITSIPAEYVTDNELQTAISGKANTADLATVATSGNYNDLTNKPTIPTVNNATLTIQKNGTTTENVADYANAEITTNVPQMQRAVLRPDAELVETWTYDKLWIAEEGNTLPAYSTTAQTLQASEQLNVTHEWDLGNYKYFVLVRGLVIPIYNTDEIARGRVEWSLSNSAYELVYPEADTFHALVDPTKSYGSIALSWVTTGGAFYRMPYFTNTTGSLSVYSATSYGVWINMVIPSYVSGELRINSPSFTLRCQPNVFDRSFYEALDDIRFQYVIELWREPVGSLNHNGWVANQELDYILECVYSADHKLR